MSPTVVVCYRPDGSKIEFGDIPLNQTGEIVVVADMSGAWVLAVTSHNNAFRIRPQGSNGVLYLPQGGVGVILGQRGMGAASTLREQVLGQLEERLGDYPEVLERLQERLGGAASEEGFSGRMQRGGFGMPFGGQAGGMRHGFGSHGRGNQGLQGVGRAGTQMSDGRGMSHQGLDWIEQLVEVLELKLEAIG